MANEAGTTEQILAHLAALVGFDTQNPPREIDATSPMFVYLREQLPGGFDVKVTDHGKGRVSFFARRGEPRVLFNVHLDTVPALPGSRFPAHELTLEAGRAYGRGACDIKGAAACLVTLANDVEEPLALLFTTDEEGGEGCCVAEFLATGTGAEFQQIVVAEPTQCLAEFRHRGFLSARGRFSGVSGHSSEPRALEDNAIHQLARWSGAALSAAEADASAGRRSCFNIGTIAGGVKSNVIADDAAIFWSARLSPGESNDAFMDAARSWPGSEHAEWTVSFSGPPLPTKGHGTQRAEGFAENHALETGEGLDFWTEASLFGAAGLPAIVLGPGSIEQAHVVDEWVAVAQLERCFSIYRSLVTRHV